MKRYFAWKLVLNNVVCLDVFSYLLVYFVNSLNDLRLIVIIQAFILWSLIVCIIIWLDLLDFLIIQILLNLQ